MRAEDWRMVWKNRRNQYLRCGGIINWMSKKILVSIGITLILLFKFNYVTKTLNFNDQQQPSSSSTSPIGLFIVSDEEAAKKYNSYVGTLACYAYRHSYRFILMNPKQYPVCTNMTRSVYFQKHCVISMYLLENVQIQWLLVLDADVLVVNMSKKIESYLPDPSIESSIYLIFYERFNGEIAAGNYIIRNHPWAHTFISRWIEYESRTSHFKFHNHDNGPLHMHLLDSMVGNVSQTVYDRCLRIYEKATEPTLYHTYVGCCKCALGGRWTYDHLRILRRGHSFIRDNLGFDMSKRIWSPTDFLIHGHRRDLNFYYSQEIDTYKCVNSSWILPVRKDVIMTNYTQVQDTIREFDRAAATAYPQSIGLPDISDCWPHCLDNQVRRQAFVEKVCSQNASWRSF